ncbi:sigma-70 family RNA polymerase sigma factor [Dankookia sp. GCM10030260]|uniref:sigma-70 family RNA polymerase sigma factor n=1 Tax=Dankookia sp. GCM10030260 TaxID=3273390 RepID=UPI003607CBD4
MAALPQLRIQALALTRNRAAADDLVQDAAMNALAAQSSFTPGTNFRAWMHRILRNRFISDLRKRREIVDIDDAPPASLAVYAGHEDRLVLQELQQALGEVHPVQREALFMVVLQGMSYEEVAAATDCAIGTAKSRVFRARRLLAARLLGETGRDAGIGSVEASHAAVERILRAKVRTAELQDDSEP